MKIVDVILAEFDPHPDPLPERERGLPLMGEAMYQYVVAANGLFIRAEDSRIEACVMIAPARLHGLAEIEPYARLKVEHVPGVWLWSILRSAITHMPNEAMYQFSRSGQAWRCLMPAQSRTPTAVMFNEDGQSVIDLHSHNSMPAFFSATDDGDEGGLRFYAVIGRLDAQPEIRVRAGVYGHHWDVPAEMVFDGLGPFTEVYDQVCRVCGCTDLNGCSDGCYWVEEDLCSNCAAVTAGLITDIRWREL